ncbi:MAG: hypothetical protein Q9225_001981 [Loekoesia sp. 1 TL-2023]
MSVEYESPSTSRSKTKDQGAHAIKKSKKRKRTTQEDVESPTPKGKRQLKTYSLRIENPAIPPKNQRLQQSSLFHQQTSSLYLPLPPITQNHPLQGLCAEHLSPLTLTYHPPLRGVVLAYHNAKLSTIPQQDHVLDDIPVLAQVIDEYAAPHVWLTADFLLFRPQRGNMIEGWINLQNEGNIGLVCLNFFNASIERKRLPKDWKWVAGGLDSRRSKKKLSGSERNDDAEPDQTQAIAQVNGFGDAQGHFEDGDGRVVNGLIQFTVKDVETSRSSGGDNSFLSIEGTLLDEVEERKVREAETRDEDSRARKHRRKERNALYTMSGALLADEAKNMEGEIAENSQHRSIH